MADKSECSEPEQEGEKYTKTSSRCPRILTSDEKTKLEKDVNLISDFKREKLEKEALRNWDLFYKRNSTYFFKDRHWTTREFQELLCEQVGRKYFTYIGVF